MGGLVRLVVILFVVLTAVYVVLSFLARRAERARLELLFDEEGREGDRRAFVREGLSAYDRSLRRRLILAVYLVPLVVIGTIVYVVNYR
jgi:Ca2+/Na+ antiporter